MATTPARMIQRRRTVAQWTSENPVLAAGEIGVATGGAVPLVKIGDGVTAWNTLADLVGPELATSDPAKMPVATVGDVTTLDVDSLAWTPIHASLAADSAPKNANTTLIDVTGLLLPVASNSTYMIDSFVCYNSAVAADIKFGWTVPASADGRWVGYGISTAASGVTGSINAQRNTWAQTTALGGAAAVVVARMYGILTTVGTAGNLQLQFAQNTSDVSDTVVSSFSRIWAQRVA